jgi:hypothetical protein
MILICPADPSQAAAPRRSYHSCWNTSDSDRRGRFPHRAHKKRNQGGDGSDLPGESAKRADQSGFLFDLLELLAANHLKTAKNPNKKRHFAGSRPGCVPAIPARPGNYVPAKLLSRARRGGGLCFLAPMRVYMDLHSEKFPQKGT